MINLTPLLVSALLTATPTAAWQPANAEEQQLLVSPQIDFEPVFTATDEILGPEETAPVTTTAPPSSLIPSDHWQPTDRPDPYVCEYLGYNDCWRPKYIEEGPPFSHDGVWPERKRTCVVASQDDPEKDDAPAILAAFEECKVDGHIVFEEGKTYYVGRVMNTTGLLRTTVEIKGRMVWSTDIKYWLENSLPIGFQNQTAAWHLGGEEIHVFGGGTLDGNGQVWYDFNEGVSNRHGRPHAILITDTIDSVIEGLNFIKSQMWTMTVSRSERMLLQDIYVNNTSDGRKFRANVNTDGVDTVYANNITFLRWTIDNGDDSISMKQNSTNIYIANCTFHSGEAFAMGSIGQYPGQIETIANVTAENIRCFNTRWAARVKSWTGLSKGYPPNGGGGGFGEVKNITFKNFELHDVGQAWAVTQCTSYNGMRGACWTSHLQISELHWGNTTGTITGGQVATLQCSKEAPCKSIELFNNDLRHAQDGTTARGYKCAGVEGMSGFECTGDCGEEGLDCAH